MAFVQMKNKQNICLASQTLRLHLKNYWQSVDELQRKNTHESNINE